MGKIKTYRESSQKAMSVALDGGATGKVARLSLDCMEEAIGERGDRIKWVLLPRLNIEDHAVIHFIELIFIIQ
jgi:hypothetical protein